MSAKISKRGFSSIILHILFRVYLKHLKLFLSRDLMIPDTMFYFSFPFQKCPVPHFSFFLQVLSHILTLLGGKEISLMRNNYNSSVLKLLRYGEKSFSVMCVEGTVICTSLEEPYLILYVMEMTKDKVDLFILFFLIILSVSAPDTTSHLILK